MQPGSNIVKTVRLILPQRGRGRCQVMVGNAIVDSGRKLLDAMRKPDGTYRTYDEMVAEGTLPSMGLLISVAPTRRPFYS